MTGEADAVDVVRIAMSRIFDLFYDDEPENPGLAVRDLLTDLLHLCEARNLNFDRMLESARKVHADESLEWNAERRIEADLQEGAESS